MGRDTDQKIGQLAETIREALKHRDAQREAGATPAELARNLERTLRVSWPKGREWKYLCDVCRDTGLVEHVCRRGERCPGVSSRSDSVHDAAGKYRRLCALHPDSDYEHTYMSRCLCPKGAQLQARPERDQDVPSAGKTTKPIRWGR